MLNVICPSRINPVAALLESYLPLPTNPHGYLNNNAIENNGSRTPGENQGVYAIKGDYNATSNMHFSGIFSRQYFNSYPLDGPIPGPLGEGFQEFGNTKWVRFNGDQIIRPTLLNHFAFGYNQRDLGEQGNERLGATDRYIRHSHCNSRQSELWQVAQLQRLPDAELPEHEQYGLYPLARPHFQLQ